MSYYVCKNLCSYPCIPKKNKTTDNSAKILSDTLKGKFQLINLEATEDNLFFDEIHIPSDIAQLLRLRVASLINCPFCLYLHTAMAMEVHVHALKIKHIGHWYLRDELYSAAEQAVLTYVDAVFDSMPDNFKALEEDLSEHFTEKAVQSISKVLINFKALTYLKISQHYLAVRERKCFDCTDLDLQNLQPPVANLKNENRLAESVM